MPSTNDANEGALGAYRVAIRGKPSLTLHQYNSQAMFRRNDTQDFMDAVFTDEDHAYIMREARRIDSSREEARRREEIVDFRIKTAEMQKTKALAKARKMRRTCRTTLPASLYHCVPNLLVNSKYPRKADKLAVLKEAFRWYETILEVVPVIVEELRDEEDGEMEE
ncbi:hypothetical protein DFH08DRAFT_951431 [Mycena albidolilacea]|uniref:Uncharacterized protein n=1 Tax=Mycena albidolilacea TaxID=1033008 RepID=A0AAD7AJB4_9AGAR|nr:hypothetical protein DFH08DRAFT_951431 [Mycena albidolilacea]